MQKKKIAYLRISTYIVAVQGYYSFIYYKIHYPIHYHFERESLIAFFYNQHKLSKFRLLSCILVLNELITRTYFSNKAAKPPHPKTVMDALMECFLTHYRTFHPPSITILTCK